MPVAPLPGAPLLRCAATAAVVWWVLFWFGRDIHYVGDDFTVLRPLFHGGLVDSLHEYIRPLEFGAARLSLALHFPFWLVVSFVAYVVTACLTLHLARALTPDVAGWWTIVLCAASPIAAIPYFQVDTVSQHLANLFSLLFALCTMVAVQRPPAPQRTASQVRAAAWQLVLLALLCIASKETSYGIVFAGALLLLLRHGRTVLAPVVIIGTALLLAVAWSKIAGTLNPSDAHYAFKVNPLYWVFGVVFSLVVTVTPIPTSLALTGTFGRNATTLGLAGVGAVVTLVALLLLLRSALLRTAWQRRAQLLDPFAPATLIVIFLLFSIVPSILFKVGELYASQMLPFSKALIIAAVAASQHLLARRFAVVLGLAWVLAASVNLAFYAISTGYAPAKDASLSGFRRALYLDLQDAVRHQRSQYSVYSVNMIFQNEQWGACEVRPGAGYACLPPGIGAGFPARRTE